jgi:hypothetical protein
MKLSTLSFAAALYTCLCVSVTLAAPDDDWLAWFHGSHVASTAPGPTLSVDAQGDSAMLDRLAPRVIQRLCDTTGVISWYQNHGDNTRITCRLAASARPTLPQRFTHLDLNYDTRAGASPALVSPRIDIGMNTRCNHGSFVSVAGKAVLYRSGCDNEPQASHALAGSGARPAAATLSTVNSGPVNPQWTALFSRRQPLAATPAALPADLQPASAWLQPALQTTQAR